MGRVVGLTGEAITISPEGYLRVEMTWQDEDDVRQERYYEQDNSQPMRTFRLHDRVLAISGFPLPFNRMWVGRINHGEHPLTDLRIGDRVVIMFGAARGDEFCTALSILRRPGGRVPDAFGDNDKDCKTKFSTERNAAQFTEETIAAKWGPRLMSALKR